MVIRQNKRQAKGAVNRAIKRMVEDKASIIISIEGKRSIDGTLSPFKRGPVLIALQTGATIIPIFVRGTREVWPYGDWKFRVGGQITVKFLPGIETKGNSYDNIYLITLRIDHGRQISINPTIKRISRSRDSRRPQNKT